MCIIAGVALSFKVKVRQSMTIKKKRHENSKDKRAYSSVQIVLGSALVSLLAAACVRWILHSDGVKSAAVSGVIDWHYNKTNPHQMTEWLSDHGLPIVLHNTPFDSWKSAKWTPQKLKKEPRINQILSKKGRDNVFKYFANDQPLSVHEMFDTAKPFVEVIFSRERFFDILQQPHDGYYYYSSGGIELLNIEEVYSSEDLDLLTFKSSCSGNLGQVNFWFGKENVTAYTHYDTSYNLHAIAYGRKKFIMFPPEAYHDLQLHPCLHQFYRQTQTNIFDGNYSKTLAELKGLEVILTPGEVLYIPPYWFHCVVTVETTVSLNVWSHSEVFLVMEEIYSKSLPFEESWGREKLMKILVYFLNMLARGLFKLDKSTRDILLDTVYERYRPLLTTFNDEEHLPRVQNYCLGTSINEILDTENIRHIDDRIFEINGLFERVHPQPVREINFGNYVEHTTLRILGTSDIVLLPFYIKECF